MPRRPRPYLLVLTLSLVAAGCRDLVVDNTYVSVVDSDAGAAFQNFVANLAAYRRSPGATRAAQHFACQPFTCVSHQSSAGACAPPEPGIYEDGFAQAMRDCVRRCDSQMSCFEVALSETSLSDGMRARVQACEQAQARCGTQTDACRALAVIQSDDVRSAIEVCSQAPCSLALECYWRALVVDLPDPIRQAWGWPYVANPGFRDDGGLHSSYGEASSGLGAVVYDPFRNR